ncbi:MAG TPA: type II secretion system F family protein [Smithellaceae bacterium]|jgi:type IV pilus assembly protein PilC|nr:type II secretion system F family protein [Smithellaceae bacterium]HQH05641.1 type II secretion system F family protein [Smithellaceae bacterium]HQJ78547.1 type II secretion system F family protein [Smithellaceae bacterium]
MANYVYSAINEMGKTITDSIEAESEEIVNSMLAARNLIPVRIVRQDKSGFSLSSLSSLRFGASVKTKDLILFTKQFRSMMQAGVPIIRLMQVLVSQTQDKTLKKVATEISQDIKGGMTLYAAMKKHPSVFSPLYLSMINAGEISGSVPEILERLIDIVEHEAKIKKDIKSALQYPIIVVIALVIAFVVLLTFVIPKFVAIFAKAGIALPLPTKIAMIMYQGLANYWHILLGGIIALVVFLRYYIKTPAGRYTLDTFLLKMPLFGSLFQKAAMSRFAAIFAIMQASGVPVMRTMEVVSDTIGNTAISREFDNVRDKIQEGQGISGPLRSAKHFTPMVVDMVAIGEESGNIEEMMRQVSLHYDDEVQYAVKGLADSIGPILMVGLAAVVGFFALAIFMPMWDLTKMVK